jgi:hypothetical protein
MNVLQFFLPDAGILFNSIHRDAGIECTANGHRWERIRGRDFPVCGRLANSDVGDFLRTPRRQLTIAGSDNGDNALRGKRTANRVGARLKISFAREHSPTAAGEPSLWS